MMLSYVHTLTMGDAITTLLLVYLWHGKIQTALHEIFTHPVSKAPVVVVVESL